MVFLKDFLEKIDFEKYLQTTKKMMKNYPAWIELTPAAELNNLFWIFLEDFVFIFLIQFYNFDCDTS